MKGVRKWSKARLHAGEVERISVFFAMKNKVSNYEGHYDFSEIHNSMSVVSNVIKHKTKLWNTFLSLGVNISTEELDKKSDYCDKRRHGITNRHKGSVLQVRTKGYQS